MDKRNIIHQKFDPDKFNYEQVARFHNMLKSTLPNDYILITTPTEISKIDGNDTVITIDAKEYTTNELMAIIEKAWQYDELN